MPLAIPPALCWTLSSISTSRTECSIPGVGPPVPRERNNNSLRLLAILLPREASFLYWDDLSLMVLIHCGIQQDLLFSRAAAQPVISQIVQMVITPRVRDLVPCWVSESFAGVVLMFQVPLHWRSAIDLDSQCPQLKASSEHPQVGFYVITQVTDENVKQYKSQCWPHLLPASKPLTTSPWIWPLSAHLTIYPFRPYLSAYKPDYVEVCYFLKDYESKSRWGNVWRKWIEFILIASLLYQSF